MDITQRLYLTSVNFECAKIKSDSRCLFGESGLYPLTRIGKNGRLEEPVDVVIGRVYYNIIKVPEKLT